jgi:hypothetical protein
MADYSKAELLNEVSKVFRAGLDPGRDGGTLNTATAYQQLLELTSITFLFNPDAVFYIARLAANQLNGLVLQEVAVLEDILVSLDDLGQIGEPVRDTASLSNARTAVLSLDAAQSVTNRPETQRFIKQIDAFAAQWRKNLVSVERGGLFVRPREEARDLIQANLLQLDVLHSRLLEQTFALRDTLTEFLSLDLPSMVSATALKAISDRLQATIDELGSLSDTENIAASRRIFLESLANKVSVEVLSTFTDPTEFKFRGPQRPIPPTMKHTGQVVGQGTAASVLTSAGPWVLPISAPLVLSANGGAPVSIDLDSIQGAVLNCRNSQGYRITASAQDLHVVVDSDIYESTVVASDGTYVALAPMPTRLGFKHLGALVAFPDTSMATPSDLQLRFITDLNTLQLSGAPNVTFADPVLTVAAWFPINEAAIGFQPGHLGGYIYDNAGQRFEITKIVDANTCWVDVRGLTPDWSYIVLFAQLASGASSYFSFSPSLASIPSAGHRVRVGPSTKTARLTIGTRTAANLISDIEAENGAFVGANHGATLNWHVKPLLVSGDPTRLALQIRSKANPMIQVSGRFLSPQDPVDSATVEETSAHQVLGLFEGEADTTNLLTPAELAAKINELAGFSAAVETTELATGVLQTNAGGATVTGDKDLQALGVRTNDQLLISSGVAAGVCRVVSASGATLTLDHSAFIATEAGIAYRAFREQVRISTSSSGPGSSLEVVSYPVELDLVAGKTYSAIPTFEAVNKAGDKLSFDGVVAGDLLRVVGQSDVEITEVQDGTTLILVTGLPSNTVGVGFEIRSAAAKAFTAFNALLTTFTESRNLLRKNNFDQGVDAIDNACTAAVLPGQNFISSRNQAKRMVADLLAILTSDLLRTDEYTASVTPDPNNLSDLLASYEASSVQEIDDLIEAFLDRKYDRAVSLLRGGKFVDFYATTDETASFSGAVMQASKAVVGDLPQSSRTQFDFLNERDLATSKQTLPDAEEDFSDTENQPEGANP